MIKRLLAIFCFIILSINYAISAEESIHTISDVFLADYIKMIESGQYKKASSFISEDARKTVSNKDLEKLFSFIKSHGKVSKFDSVGSNVFQMEELVRINKTFQLTYKDKYALVTAQIIKENDKVKINSFNFREMNTSLEDFNKFTFTNKNPIHIAALTYTLFVPLFIIVTFIVYLRTSFSKKWRWAPFILVGLIQFSFNWTTGAFMVKPIHLHLLGSGYQYTTFSPVFLFSSLPLGAILFWIKRKKFFNSSASEESQETIENSEILEGSTAELG